MRVLVDGYMLKLNQGFGTFADSRGTQVSVVEFDGHLPAPELVMEISRRKPDVIVVGREWLPISLMFHKVLEIGQCSNAKTVIGAAKVDEVLKVRAAYNGFFDVIRLGVSDEDLLASIQRIADGHSQLNDDSLWTRVPRPFIASDLSTITRDDLDIGIIELINIGLTDREIGEVVHLSTQTIRNRISAMLEKSGLGNRTQMAWMYSNQLLTARMVWNLQMRGID